MPKKTQKEEQFIHVKGAKVHNLKDLEVKIPRNKFVVITGLSGSGKSSLAFDTLYAEGQRRYVESLSSYARQFLGKIHKPEVDFIKGIPPAIAIEQKVNSRNPRSTVGTSTEIYDYMKLLFARAGETFSPVSGKKVIQHKVSDVVDFLLTFPEKTKAMILAKSLIPNDRSLEEHLIILQKQAYARIEVRTKKSDTFGTIYKISEVLEDKKLLAKVKEICIVIDRITIAYDEDSQSRYADSLQLAFFEGKGTAKIEVFEGEEVRVEYFSNLFEADGIEFEQPSVHMFSFNNPLGACPVCEGFGKIMGIDEDLVVPDKSLSVYEEAVVAWRGEKLSYYKDLFLSNAHRFDFPIHRAYADLSEKERALLWTGNQYFTGITDFFKQLETENYKIQNRVLLSRYRGKTVCTECGGSRLKKATRYVKVAEKSIQDLVDMPIGELHEFFNTIQLFENQAKIAERILVEIQSRLSFMVNVGLPYLTLNRLSSSLSGGESQRINLATSLGSSLVGSLYILDEPSIGLHSRDTERLIKVLKDLQNLGNTVVVVEHDEEIIRAADEIIDIGPLAGSRGGELVFQGDAHALIHFGESLTTQYLTGKLEIPIPKIRRKWSRFIEVKNVYENNLKNISVKFPLNVFTVVTGVSGSGKSSLVRNVLHLALSRQVNGYGNKPGKFGAINNVQKEITNVEFVDQNPIGRSSRSNPVTYIKAYDEIRKLFSEQQASKVHNFKPSHFSFNVEGGRCEECQGEGTIKVEMQFMADVTLECESCKGKRFKEDVLDVHYQGKSIYEVLSMTVEDAIVFFSQIKASTEQKIVQKMQLLADVGLGYVQLGQSSSTLSGGESQRIKLASFLSKENAGGSNLFIFDEPTTGLHFHDIHKLLGAFNALIERGNSIIVIEHNMDIIKSADWIIDLGKEGGKNGGNIIAEGTPEEVAKNVDSYTAHYLREKLKISL